jgi:hypothetical protein
MSKENLPFSGLKFESDITAFCAQLKTGFVPAIEFLHGATISRDDLPLLISAMTQMPSASFRPLRDDFLRRIIDTFVSEDIACDVIPQFSALLPTPLLLHFLETAAVCTLTQILGQLRIPRDDFGTFEPFVLKLIVSFPPAGVTKTVCGFRFARFYSK